MLTDIKRQKKFKQDYKLMIKQNRDISLLNSLIVDLYKQNRGLTPRFYCHISRLMLT
jgi:mRNA-degrading endonuclease YafQ of YafQ-DinJ toxin-antitoxin module